MVQKVKCPCEKCVSLAICKLKDELRCSIIYDFLEVREFPEPYDEDAYADIRVIERFYGREVSSCFPVPGLRYYIRWEEDE